MQHYIFVQWKAPESEQDDLAQSAEQLFAKAENILGIQTVSLSRACIQGPNRCDLMIHMELSQEALIAFDGSELHQQWKVQFGPHIAQKWIFDRE